MGIATFPAAAAASKTMFRTTLTSGTSYTVPANVTYLNVTLIGGGGGAGGTGSGRDSGAGNPGELISSTLSATAGASIAYAIGAGASGGTVQSSRGGTGGTTTFTGATSAAGGTGGSGADTTGNTGSVSYANNGAGSSSGGASAQGATGGAGVIYIEYWAQEKTMRTFAVIENNTVVNIIVGVEPEVVAANPGKYIDYTDGWTYPEGIDGGIYFPVPEVTE